MLEQGLIIPQEPVPRIRPSSRLSPWARTAIAQNGPRGRLPVVKCLRRPSPRSVEGELLEHSKEKRSRSEVISAFLTSWALRLLGTPPRVSVWSGDSGCSDVSVDSMVPTAEGALVAGNFDWLGRQTAGDSGGFDKRSAAVQATVRQRCSTAIHALEGKALHQRAFQWSGAEI